MPTLKDLRERALLSQGELAKAAGVYHETVYSWESGRKLPKPENRRRLVEIFQCTPDELLAAIKTAKAEYERRKKEGEIKRAA